MADIQFQEELTQYLSKIRGLMPVGTPWWGFDIKSKPRGVQLYLGQTLNRVMYPVHFEYIQTYRTIVTEEEWKAYAEAHNGLCPYFSYGDNQYTYRMPRIVDVHPRFGNCIEEVGQYLEAGIPNIIGSVGQAYNGSSINGGWHNFNNGGYGTGALYLEGTNNGSSCTWSNYGDAGRIKIDASRCSSVYRNDIDTIQPPAINMIIGEYVTSGISTIDVITAENIQTNIELLETRFTNFVEKSDLEKYNTSYVVEHWSEETQWYRKWSNGWIEQGGTNYVSGNPYNLSFPLVFSNINYTFIGFYKDIDDNASITGCAWRNKETSYVRLVQGYNGTSYPDNIMWYACGY